jgi:hypothetical protein
MTSTDGFIDVKGFLLLRCFREKEPFRKNGISYEVCKQPKSDLFRDMLPLLNSGRISLPRHDRLIAQIVGLERRVSRAGRDSIDHAPGAHDDIANAVSGVVAAIASGVGSAWMNLVWDDGRFEEFPPRMGLSVTARIGRAAYRRRNRGDARRLRGSDDRCRAVGVEEIPPPTRRGQGRRAATRLAAVSRPTRAACAETLAWARRVGVDRIIRGAAVIL